MTSRRSYAMLLEKKQTRTTALSKGPFRWSRMRSCTATSETSPKFGNCKSALHVSSSSSSSLCQIASLVSCVAAFSLRSFFPSSKKPSAVEETSGSGSPSATSTPSSSTSATMRRMTIGGLAGSQRKNGKPSMPVLTPPPSQ